MKERKKYELSRLVSFYIKRIKIYKEKGKINGEII
jgi:hypothetical protein